MQNNPSTYSIMRHCIRHAMRLCVISTALFYGMSGKRASAEPVAKAIAASEAKMPPRPDPTPGGCRFSPPGSVLGLAEALDRALCNNPQTRQAWAAVKGQVALVGVSRASYWPTLAASLAVNESDSTVSASGASSVPSDQKTTIETAELDLNWVLFDFGRRDATLDSVQLALLAVRAEEDATLQKVHLDTTDAYYAVMTARASLDSDSQAEKSAKRIVEAADAKYKAGVGPLVDSLQAKTSYALATAKRVKSEGELKIAQGVLASAIGLAVTTPLEVVAPDNEIPSKGFEQTIEGLLETAKRRNPNLAAARARFESAQAQVRAVRAEGRPTVSVVGKLGYEDQYGQPKGDVRERYASLGVQLSIPIFEGFGNYYKIRSAEASADAKAADLAVAEQQVLLDVWTDYQELRAATENLASTRDLVRQAGQAYEIALGRYKAGVGTLLDLLNAQNAVANAQQQRTQALSIWLTSQTHLAAHLGKLERRPIQ